MCLLYIFTCPLYFGLPCGLTKYCRTCNIQLYYTLKCLIGQEWVQFIPVIWRVRSISYTHLKIYIIWQQWHYYMPNLATLSSQNENVSFRRYTYMVQSILIWTWMTSWRLQQSLHFFGFDYAPVKKKKRKQGQSPHIHQLTFPWETGQTLTFTSLPSRAWDSAMICQRLHFPTT